MLPKARAVGRLEQVLSGVRYVVAMCVINEHTDTGGRQRGDYRLLRTAQRLRWRSRMNWIMSVTVVCHSVSCLMNVKTFGSRQAIPPTDPKFDGHAIITPDRSSRPRNFACVFRSGDITVYRRVVKVVRRCVIYIFELA